MNLRSSTGSRRSATTYGRPSTATPGNGKAPRGAGGKPPKSAFREWADALIFALVVMLIVRTFLFDLFRIPTPSMENSLLTGDYLFVSKLHYGTRTPVTLGVPFTKLFVEGVRLPHTRLPGFTKVKRGDAVVFNYPPENKPVDRKEHYIKRIMGLPGETLEVRDKVVVIDGKPQPLLPTMQYLWAVYKNDPNVHLSEERLRLLGIKEAHQTSDPSLVLVRATESGIQNVRALPYIDRVEPYIASPNAGYGAEMYPAGRGYTPDNYGPVLIPKKGMQTPLNNETWPVYGAVISRYEGHSAVQLADGSFRIDGKPAESYTFEQDYYFAMGDNRDNSEDSRFWGFVPMDHVVGRALLVYFSWDAEAHLPRFNRLFKLID